MGLEKGQDLFPIGTLPYDFDAGNGGQFILQFSPGREFIIRYQCIDLFHGYFPSCFYVHNFEFQSGY